jgi:hypothetical protein
VALGGGCFPTRGGGRCWLGLGVVRQGAPEKTPVGLSRGPPAWGPVGVGSLPGVRWVWAPCLESGGCGLPAWSPVSVGSLPGVQWVWAPCLESGCASELCEVYSIQNVTRGMLCAVRHVRYVMCGTSRAVRHAQYITRGMSRVVRHTRYVTCGTSCTVCHVFPGRIIRAWAVFQGK